MLYDTNRVKILHSVLPYELVFVHQDSKAGPNPYEQFATAGRAYQEEREVIIKEGLGLDGGPRRYGVDSGPRGRIIRGFGIHFQL